MIQIEKKAKKRRNDYLQVFIDMDNRRTGTETGLLTKKQKVTHYEYQQAFRLPSKLSHSERQPQRAM
jgi:hypothetical protein